MTTTQAPKSKTNSDKQKTHYRTCNLCEAMCGIEIVTSGKQILSIKGDKLDTFSRGHICPKATALQDLHEDPDRLRQPIEKINGQWKEISWEAAYEKTVAYIKAVQSKYGHDAVGTYLGNPNVHNLGSMLFGRELLHALNTKNKFSATSVDQLPHHIIAHKLFGHQLKVPVPDIDNCDHFLIIGANPVASNGSIMSVPDVKTRLKDITKKGGEVIVIDPRLTETAEIASKHHFIKPGSDVLLLLAMLNTLFNEKLAKPGRLKEFTPEWNQLALDVEPYTAERVTHHTGIEASDIKQLVRNFANANASVCYARMGASVQTFGTLTQYLIMAFNILNGRLDARGGMMFTQPAADLISHTGKGHFGRTHSRVRQLPGFSGELPVSALAEDILTEGEGQIKAMVMMAGNPVLSTPNGQQLDKAFQNLDFMVSIDFYINESNRHADIILPPVSILERSHYDLIFHLLAVRNTAKYNPPLFKAEANTKQDWEILLELSHQLRSKTDLKSLVMHKAKMLLGPEAQLDFMLRSGPYGGGLNLLKGMSLRKLKAQPHGIDLGELKPVLPKALKTKDKKINLSREFFMADLPRVDAHFFSDEAKNSDRPFSLIGRRHVRSNNSWLHNSKRLVKGKNRCTVMIHPYDATALNIENAQTVKVASRVGQVELPAEITEHVMQGVVSIPHGFGHNRHGTGWKIAEAHAGVSVNDLTDDMQIDALSGNAVLNGVPVSIQAL
jgi:anaerobic selenocysteine-containing dehydrogenase